MAGSKRYLQLLSNMSNRVVPVYPGGTDQRWDYLKQRWYHLTQSQSPYNLEELAFIAYQILSVTQGESMKTILDRAEKLHIAKNAGYAGADNKDPWANFRLSTVFGISPVRGVLVRMSDKYIRIQNLLADWKNERVGESIWDTLADLAAYALIAVCLDEEDRNQTQYHPV